jgi:hypothetical protein
MPAILVLIISLSEDATSAPVAADAPKTMVEFIDADIGHGAVDSQAMVISVPTEQSDWLAMVHACTDDIDGIEFLVTPSGEVIAHNGMIDGETQDCLSARAVQVPVAAGDVRQIKLMSHQF